MVYVVGETLMGKLAIVVVAVGAIVAIEAVEPSLVERHVAGLFCEAEYDVDVGC